jgi:hypothetical protein
MKVSNTLNVLVAFIFLLEISEQFFLGGQDWGLY